ncbi:MAG: hypothetical protein ACRYHA_07065 [Janthinobacterium lividum]
MQAQKNAGARKIPHSKHTGIVFGPRQIRAPVQQSPRFITTRHCHQRHGLAGKRRNAPAPRRRATSARVVPRRGRTAYIGITDASVTGTCIKGPCIKGFCIKGPCIRGSRIAVTSSSGPSVEAARLESTGLRSVRVARVGIVHRQRRIESSQRGVVTREMRKHAAMLDADERERIAGREERNDRLEKARRLFGLPLRGAFMREPTQRCERQPREPLRQWRCAAIARPVPRHRHCRAEGREGRGASVNIG